ncbi:MAG: hypothetical protein L0H74_05955 [Brachybacterium sp.]|nr:hypothetical protein [Brachybacterium sp.]
MSDHAAQHEAALEAEARHRAEEIRATEAAAERAAAAQEEGPSPDATIDQVHGSGRQLDHSDAEAYHRTYAGRRGPRR